MDSIKDATERAKNWPEDYHAWLYGSEKHGGGRTDLVGISVPPAQAKRLESVTGTLGPRVLLVDIENSPNLAYVWDVWQQDINPQMVLETKEILCFAAKWLDEDDIMFYSLYHSGRDEMIKNLWLLMDEADIVIDYNGSRHDILHINQDLLIAGYDPPSPYRHIDLYKTVKRKFNFTYKSLDHVNSKLGITTKRDKPGFETWLGCMRNDPDAWDRMMVYNIGDIPPLEALYLRLRPWIVSHPSMAAMSGERRCPYCNGTNLQKRGKTHTQQRTYQRLRCNDCGAWSRSTKSDSGIDIRPIAE